MTNLYILNRSEREVTNTDGKAIGIYDLAMFSDT